MKILVTGAGGMLARACVAEIERRGHRAVGLRRAELDVTDATAVTARIRAERPDAVLHCAAYTAVDRAETEEALATLVNGASAGYLAAACGEVGARPVYPSTDYVFDGSSGHPYGPEDEPRPINAYGRSKLAGERAVLQNPDALVVRTSWLYGAGGPNFVDTIRTLAADRSWIDVVDDQFGRPTSTLVLAGALVALLEKDGKGIFHATGGGDPASWHDVARRVVEWCGLRTDVRPVTSEAFPRPARRPARSVLECGRTETIIGWRFPDWQDSLQKYLEGEHHG